MAAAKFILIYELVVIRRLHQRIDFAVICKRLLKFHLFSDPF